MKNKIKAILRKAIPRRFHPATGRAVLTVYYTGVKDHQNNKLPPAITPILPLAHSITGATLTVFVNTHQEYPIINFVESECKISPYLQRWFDYYEYLKVHPEIKYIWCVDGTDVLMLNSPWIHMKKGVLYVGHESEIVNCSWLRDKNKSNLIHDFIAKYADRTLVNAGVVGGDRATILAFLRKQTETIKTLLETEDLQSDMGVFNYTVYTFFSNKVRYSKRITTVFKQYQINPRPRSWWKHK